MPAALSRTTAALLAVLLAGALGACDTTSQPPKPPPGPAWTELTTFGATKLSKRTAGDGKSAFLQEIDLKAMRVDQVSGAPDPTQPAPAGDYYPGVTSPRFTRITVPQMQAGCSAKYGVATFSAVNFAFFEEYDPSTRLSFPVKVDGTVLSGGSSPWGPVANPKDVHYKTIKLKALVLDDQRATIVDYDPASGAPLNAAAPKDALVSYDYRDHPSLVLNGDPPNRYQLLGVRGEFLMILTVEHLSLTAAAELLRQRGATGDIMTFDGGVSTFLWNAALGTLVPPASKDGALPHYLCVHVR